LTFPLRTPITALAGSLTQTVGSATGLGAPVNNLLTTLGNVLDSDGHTLASTGNNPLATGLGGVVSATGTTLASAGGLQVRKRRNTGALHMGAIVDAYGLWSLGLSTRRPAGRCPFSLANRPIQSTLRPQLTRNSELRITATLARP